MNKTNFFMSNEEHDFNLLTLFNNIKLALKKLGRTPEKHYYDASGYTSFNQLVEIELKNRNGKYINNSTIELKNRYDKPYQQQTVFIEPQHYARLIDDWRYDGIIPLYINFLNDDNSKMVWNLATLKTKPEWQWVANINDKGRNTTKGEWRILLPVSEAFIYDEEGNILYNPNEQ